MIINKNIAILKFYFCNIFKYCYCYYIILRHTDIRKFKQIYENIDFINDSKLI